MTPTATTANSPTTPTLAPAGDARTQAFPIARWSVSVTSYIPRLWPYRGAVLLHAQAALDAIGEPKHSKRSPVSVDAGKGTRGHRVKLRRSRALGVLHFRKSPRGAESVFPVVSGSRSVDNQYTHREHWVRVGVGVRGNVWHIGPCGVSWPHDDSSLLSEKPRFESRTVRENVWTDEAPFENKFKAALRANKRRSIRQKTSKSKPLLFCVHFRHAPRSVHHIRFLQHD